MSTRSFDPTAPLPSGRVLLEASAGTGKTWTIAALVARYVAEAGVPIDQLLVVTFTRAATSELRERTRARLVEAAHHLRESLATTAEHSLPPQGEVRRSRDGGAPPIETGSPPPPPTTEDPILTHLADCDPEERALRLRRLEDALRSFDRATITTLHGLAHRFLVEMGLLARTSLPSEVTGDQRELVDQVLNDLYIRLFSRSERPLAVRTAKDIARAVAAHPDADIIPVPGATDADPDVRSRFAHLLRDSLTTASARQRIASYDGLLMSARDAVVHPETGPAAAARLQQRYRVALIDEFQDTDGIQWQTVDAVFGDLAATMILIGDPKQSIYAFRGADIGAYLAAASVAANTFTLDTNYRSDAPLLRAFDTVFDGVRFGDERISYRRVSAAPTREHSGIRGVDAPLVIRALGSQSPVRKIGAGTLAVPAAREFIAEDAAAYVVGLLTRPAQLNTDDEWRPVRPGDIAILCRSRHEVDLVRAALAARRVPSVTGHSGNVLISEAAEAWLTLLSTFEYASERRVRAAALTPFFGWTAADLVSADDDAHLTLFEHIAAWSHILETEGVAALWKQIESDTEVTRRVLGQPNGERLLTDLGHVTEMIHTAHRAGALSIHDWLLAAMQQAAEREEGDETRSRRLETDSDAVHVLTAHASKGLEFPIVLCPFLWKTGWGSDDVPVFHPQGSDRRLIDVGGPESPRFTEAKELHTRESDAEEMRLLYVALTRARHHSVVWWAWVKETASAPLTRFLFRRNPVVIDDDVKVVSDTRLFGYLDQRVAASDGTISATVVTDPPDESHYRPEQPPAPQLAVARFGRTIDLAWTRTSFSGLTADAPHEAAETLVTTDEPPPAAEVEESPAMPMATLPAGASFGSLVHAVFEDVDLGDADRAERILEACRIRIGAAGSLADPETLAAALLRVAETPLFADPTSTRLVDIPRQDQLVEMIFDIPVSPDGLAVPVAGFAALLERHLPADHPLRPYGERLRTLSRTRFHGFLTGAIDATVRIGEPRSFWIMDYKTNRLGDPSRTLTLDDYRPAALDAAMLHGDYVLQSLLYQVALHRYLGVRLPGYRPETHLGGSLYLFVRGMIGADTPATADGRFGVHRWNAPTELIVAVSDLFERGLE